VKNCQVGKTNNFINFAVAFLALLSKRKKEKHSTSSRHCVVT